MFLGCPSKHQFLYLWFQVWVGFIKGPCWALSYFLLTCFLSGRLSRAMVFPITAIQVYSTSCSPKSSTSTWDNLLLPSWHEILDVTKERGHGHIVQPTTCVNLAHWAITSHKLQKTLVESLMQIFALKSMLSVIFSQRTFLKVGHSCLTPICTLIFFMSRSLYQPPPPAPAAAQFLTGHQVIQNVSYHHQFTLLKL